MSERRMFAKTITESDAFLGMPLSAQALYFHLGMEADDDGFVNSPRRVQRIIGASDDDFQMLVEKRFILTFDSGIIVIKHFKIHNWIRKDRYRPTQYRDELSTLEIKENGAYTERVNQVPTKCQPSGIPSDTLGKVSIGKVSIGKSSYHRGLDDDEEIELNEEV